MRRTVLGSATKFCPRARFGSQPVHRQQLGDVGAGMGHQEIVTSTTPWPRSAICEKPSGDRSTTRGSPAPSRSSTVQLVDAPVASFTTVTTVPNGKRRARARPGRGGRVPRGLADLVVGRRGARRRSRRRGRGRRGCVVVVGGGGAAAVVAVAPSSTSWPGRGCRRRCREGTGAGAVVVVVAGAWYATRCDGRFTPSGLDARAHGIRVSRARRAPSFVIVTHALIAFCNSRRGAPNNAPQMIAATPRRLPPVLWFRRAPPFSGDTVHPRRHTGGEGFLENLDNHLRATQTRNGAETFCGLFSQVTAPRPRDI